MSHAFATVAIEFKNPVEAQNPPGESRAKRVEAVLKAMRAPPVRDWRSALDTTGIVHFISINVFPPQIYRGVDQSDQSRDPLPGKAYLLIEASVDGGTEQALRAIARALDVPLREMFREAGIEVPDGGPAELLLRNQLKLGQGWFGRWFGQALGLPFDGSPGMSVKRLCDEAALAHRIAEMSDTLAGPAPARQKLEEVRQRLWNDGDSKWAFVPEPTPVLQPARIPQPAGQRMVPLSRRLVKLLPQAIPTLLWPIVLAFLALWVGFAWWWWFVGWLGAIILSLLAAAVVGIVLPGLWAFYHLQHLEATDSAIDHNPDPTIIGEIMKREGIYAQGLLASVSTLKPGFFRRALTLRLAFWLVHNSTLRFAKPGLLGRIGVIHFARWFLLPGTNKLFFWSNYDGAWESYVEDFIQLGQEGVTAIWSNTKDFPKTRRLFSDGAADGDRLRRWARCQMYPALFWYSAYPQLTLARMRANAAIRAGIAEVRTEAKAEEWLSNFGFAPRSPSVLNVEEIPTLVFGGRRHLRFGTCLVVTMSEDPQQCRKWVSRIEPHLTYAHDRTDWAVALGISTTGFVKLGLPPEDIDTFPAVFRNGMTASWRSQALGDLGENAPEHWAWGYDRNKADAVLLLYARSAAELGRRKALLQRYADEEGQIISYAVKMRELPADGSPMREPFGFLDGISQPELKGGPRLRQGHNPLHAMEPGEFVLGYRDNSKYLPSTPSVQARLDPENVLPNAGEANRRDFGRNGTYLVIRQLQQDIGGFNEYLTDEAQRQLGSALGQQAPTVAARRELIAAKMMGRWRQDGSSLVRHPHPPRPGQPRSPDNDFRYGEEDPHGVGCPFGAHIRRANPRDSLDPTSPQAISITNRHRIKRVGRSYEIGEPEPEVGTLFMCVNADIERQFEFLQQTWTLGRNFNALEDEADALNARVGNDPERPWGGEKVFTVPTRDGPVTLRGLPDFVRVRGGGYFFMPSRRAVHFLVRMAVPAGSAGGS